MRLDLKLPDLRLPQLSESLLRRPMKRLRQIQERNEAKWGAGGGSKIFNNRKEKLRKRLQGSINPRRELTKIQSTEVGWQRLLLGLYVESHGQDWLPTFDDEVATGILGTDASAWNTSRRRQATLLFFERFDTLPAVSFLAEQLRKAYGVNASAMSGVGAIWANERDSIFHPDGPQRIAKKAAPGEKWEQLRGRFGIPEKGRFSEKLRQIYLLETLQRCPLGDEPAVLQEIERCRSEPALDSLCLGAAALRILVLRVEQEGRCSWPHAWQRWIVRLGCDPGMARLSAEGATWWGWATDSQLRIAQQGVTGLTLRFFIGVLEHSLRGTEKESQFALRSRFLLALFEAGKIQDTRLCLNWAQLQRMRGAMAVSEIEQGTYDHYIAHLSDTTDKTSMICLRCTDDIFIIEGTHTFGLRVYRGYGRFPITGFWERSRETYQDRELRVGRDFIPHDQWGRWVEKFFDELRWKHHLENNWRDVKI